jgi:cation diffusion facilitator CzcD-associated flavoprotein CzcO
MALDAKQTAKVRSRVNDIVKDKETAAKLTPWYPTCCKRPTFSDVFLQTFNKEHVHLVDTNGKGIESVTPQGIQANGKECPIDMLVLGTGYRSPVVVGGNQAGSIDMEVTGRNGRRLSEKWKSQGATTLHGCCTNGFPNFFWAGISQAAVSVNVGNIIEITTDHIGHIIRCAHEISGGKKTKGVVIETSQEAEEDWSMRIMQGAALFSSIASYTPGYVTGEGENMSADRAQRR